MNAIYGLRLKAWRKQANLSQRALATAMSVSQGYISDIEVGRSGPSRDFLATLSEKFGVNPSWIMDGREPITFPGSYAFAGRTAVIEPPEYDRPGHGDLRIDGYDCVRIRRMDLSVSAGSGVTALEGPDAAPLVVPTVWMQNLRINADLAVLVSVKGDSMSPGIPDQALVLVHLMEKPVLKAGVYAFNLDGHSFIKRLVPSEPNGDGRPQAISIISDNPAYPPKLLVGSRLNDLRVVGRVRAVLAVI